MTHLIHIDIEDQELAIPTPEIAQERKVAVFDLLEENSFSLPVRSGLKLLKGPYKLILGIREGRLAFDVRTSLNEPATLVALSLTPLRPVIKDYSQICEAYYDAVKTLPPAQIEAIDMGRRGIHDEGGRLLQERLENKIILDKLTARRLFTLICVLHFKG
tara:strand:+ start:91 stop:570 length:480 start_codon:yes stop_codon:yes gene_type:complete